MASNIALIDDGKWIRYESYNTSVNKSTSTSAWTGVSSGSTSSTISCTYDGPFRTYSFGNGYRGLMYVSMTTDYDNNSGSVWFPIKYEIGSSNIISTLETQTGSISSISTATFSQPSSTFYYSITVNYTISNSTEKGICFYQNYWFGTIEVK